MCLYIYKYIDIYIYIQLGVWDETRSSRKVNNKCQLDTRWGSAAFSPMEMWVCRVGNPEMWG